MARWFFMSYAHVEAHRDSAMVQDFFDDLCAEIASKTTTAASDCGYLDKYDLKPGDVWKDDLAEALCTCRTFVCIMSARYFSRPYCGREWALFETRCRQYAEARGEERLPSLIIPVLWDKPFEGNLPAFATDLQFGIDLRSVNEPDERRNLDDLHQRGLRHIMKRRPSTHLNAYETIRENLATRILSLAQEHALPAMPAAQIPPLDTVAPKFPAQAPPADGNAAAPAGPARQANFVLVAGTAEEMRGHVGDREHSYGRGDPREWTPYFPENQQRFFLIAQRLATEHELLCRWLPIDEALIDKLKTAKDQNSIALMVVDPWSARLPKYAGVLREFDNFVFRNCVVLIPWDTSDCSAEERESLQQALQSVLEGRFAVSNDCYLRADIPTMADFEAQISDALRDLEEILAVQREPQRDMPRGRFASLPSIDPTGG